MEPHFIVQASGAMFDTLEPQGWTYVFAIFVTDQLPLVSYVSPLIASFIIVPLLLIPLTALNQYILAWRKIRVRRH
jgi:hypothetical protein